MGVAKYPINEDFFNQDSEEYWYVMGLIASDGYVSDDKIELCLNNKDEHLLIQIRDKVCPGKPIYNKPSTHAKRFTIHSKHVAQKVKSALSMTTNKKAAEVRLPNIPDQFVKDFVRGLIDGDGCIDTTKAYRDGKVYIGPRLRILSNRMFLEELLEAIRKFVPNNTKSVSKKGAEGVWYIAYNFASAKSVLQWCYDNNNICLRRKYKKYKEVTS